MFSKALRRAAALFLILRANYLTSSKISLSALVDSNTKFEGRNSVGRRAAVYGSTLGFATFVGADCSLPRTRIGRFCSIGHRVEVLWYTHPTSYVSTHPAFYSTLAQAGFTFTTTQRFQESLFLNNDSNIHAHIGNDVWIGAHVIILGGVTIGDGAIVAAGAIVTKDVEPFCIVAGIPARVIGSRFLNDEIEFLAGIKWWARDFSWLQQYSKYFDSVERLKIAMISWPEHMDH